MAGLGDGGVNAGLFRGVKMRSVVSTLGRGLKVCLLLLLRLLLLLNVFNTWRSDRRFSLSGRDTLAKLQQFLVICLARITDFTRMFMTFIL